MKKLICNRLPTKCTALLLIMAMLFSVTCVFPFHVYSASSTGTIADGVYTISNNYLTDNYSSYGSFYLRANCLVSENNSTPSVYMSTDTYGGFRFNLLRYWKVEHLGNEVYVFRSLADPNQMLGRSGSTVTLIKTDGTTIPNSVKWKYNSGYWKSVSNENQCLTARNTPSAAPSHYNSALYHYYVDATVMNTEYMSFDRFSLTSVSVTGVCWRNEQTGKLVSSFSSNRYNVGEQTILYSDLGYSLVAYNASEPVSILTWSSNNNSVAEVDFSGVVTMKSAGMATITGALDNTTQTISYALNVKDAEITYNARLYYDSSCLSLYTQAELQELYKDAASEILDEFGIYFNLEVVGYSSLLNLSSQCAGSSMWSICTSSCADVSSCNLSHHKGSKRLLNLIKSSAYHTYRLVGYALCYYDDSHREVIGLGSVNGQNSITSALTTTNIVRSIQHELTHNLGASHDTCVGNSVNSCVLSGTINTWCSACRNAIEENMQ